MELTVLGQETDGGCSKSGCGADAGQTDHLPAHIRDKVKDHPCYSEEAHHHYARMHVAVAPACNIQCHYCNRKFDCANESRPGVVSELLTPDEAADKTLAVAASIPQMTVLGIAGPGDPLANPERSFETFRRIKDRAPDIKLCISTNGLALPDHVDTLVDLGVDHVTITINCLDEEIGARIYPWIFFDHRRIRGKKASRILIERQLQGLDMLVERGVLVKVNSVMIPGVNDGHLPDVSRVVKAKGAFLHNVMPLIAEAEHGTYYGVMGQRGPTPAEVEALQDQCAGDMAMMRHCRQCRADAVGLLGEDRGQEFTRDKVAGMAIDDDAAREKRAAVRAAIEAGRRPPANDAVLVAVASSGSGVVDLHFGHAEAFQIYEVSSAGVRFVETRSAEAYCTGPEACDDGDDTMARLIRALDGCRAVVCSRIGMGPWKRLEAAGIRPFGEYHLAAVEGAVWAAFAEMTRAGLLDIRATA